MTNTFRMALDNKCENGIKITLSIIKVFEKGRIYLLLLLPKRKIYSF